MSPKDPWFIAGETLHALPQENFLRPDFSEDSFEWAPRDISNDFQSHQPQLPESEAPSDTSFPVATEQSTASDRPSRRRQQPG
jgi:hypothetical protein